jgi:hypothetical protein
MSRSKSLLTALLIGAAVIGMPAARPQIQHQDIVRTEILKVPPI